MTRKPAYQLDREIADALTKGSRRRHATRQPGADVWDVAMDAILEHDPQRAAQVVKQIRGKQRATETPEFSRALQEAPDPVRMKFLELTAPKSIKPAATAIAFFRKHGGYVGGLGESKIKAKTRAAQSLARAEAMAEALGWSVEWEHDPDSDMWRDDEPPFEVLSAVLYDKDRNVLAGLASIGMTGNSRTDRDYRRVVEGELASEALYNLGIRQ